MEPDFSFIILTYNEEIHLFKTLTSLQRLGAPIYILDSGSTDRTLEIANHFNAIVKHNLFENHPKQWDFAISHFSVTTPWIIGLDADQVVSAELYNRLKSFKDSAVPKDIEGIYLNRKNVFRGRWIKHGGYFPKFLLKMFRTGLGKSDLNENMDHKFYVKGKTVIWNDGYLLEENLKENNINFWLEKHLRYSDLVAQEEVERIKKIRIQLNKRNLFGTPDERVAFLKSIWWRLPLYWRPCLYFFFRFFIQLGFLDGKEGRLFHFLQGFWFRLIVDIKIEELLEADNKR